jgi:2-oxo-3-hexenedioate decarboxylase/2-keto-4-pentenoate hydratase
MQTTAQRAAAILLDQRLAGTPIGPLPTELEPQDMTACYAIQTALNEMLTSGGHGKVVGHKIGCTTPVMQAFVGINHPATGRVFDHTVMHGHGTVSRKHFVKIGIECEVAVRLAKDLLPRVESYTRESVAEAVGEIMVGMELVDERYTDYRTLGVRTLAADDFYNAGCVLGEPVKDWHHLDLANLTGRTWINEVEVASGNSSLVMGHPLNALAWLANAHAEHGLPGLKVGEFILLGSVVETQWLNAGDRVRIDVSGLGSVSLDIED